jgi:hypothetical protein
MSVRFQIEVRSVSEFGIEGKGEGKLGNCYTRLRDCWDPTNEKGLRQKATDVSSERKRVLRLAEVNDLASLRRRANCKDASNREKERTNLALPAYVVPDPGQYSFVHKCAAYRHSYSSLSCHLSLRRVNDPEDDHFWQLQ